MRIAPLPAAMHMDPIMPYLVSTVAAILLLGLLVRLLRQPQIIAYLLAGIALGPAGIGLVSDQLFVARVGEIGVILLLFFVGTEISLPALLAKWRVSVIGTLLQVAVSVACVAGVGAWQGWSLGRSVLLGFVISLSSTAVVIKVLQEKGEINQPMGQDVVGILLVQDLAFVPMLIIIGLMGDATPTRSALAIQSLGGILLVALLAYVAKRGKLHLPLAELFRGDQELQVFAGGVACFGLALLTGLAGLSAALGAFVAGIVVGATGETRWIRDSLFSFHVLLLALFFVSMGMLIDLHFVWDHLGMILLLLLALLLTNTVLNTLILRILGRPWSSSLYGGATLAQIGEFSFVLAALGRQTDLVEDFAYQTTGAVIVLSMLLSPTWIAAAAYFQRPAASSMPVKPASDTD